MKRQFALAVIATAAMAITLVGCGVKITNIVVPDAVTVEKGEAVVLPVAFGTDDAPAVTPETAATGESAATDEKVAKAAEKLTIEWTSSDESVATVDETGTVTAVAAGEATITANAGEKSATYKLTVQAKKVAQTTTNKNTNKGNTSSSSNTAPASNPAPAQPAAPAEQPSQPTYVEPAPDPQPEQPAQDSQPSGGGNDNSNSGDDWWNGPVLSSPTDNGCTPEQQAGGVC